MESLDIPDENIKCSGCDEDSLSMVRLNSFGENLEIGCFFRPDPAGMILFLLLFYFSIFPHRMTRDNFLVDCLDSRCFDELYSSYMYIKLEANRDTSSIINI